MIFLKHSTAVVIVIGPFVDETDGFTAETGLTITQADVRLSKSGLGSFAQKNAASSCTHIENGYYACALNATDTNTLGRLVVAINEAGARPVIHEYMILTANAYDSLCDTDALQVHAVEIDNDLITADALAADAAAAIADAVWDEALSGHTTGGTTGKALADAGAAGDPWGASLPGSYSAGEAGYIIGTNLDQKISLINQSPGAGAITFTYTLTSSVDSSPIEDADVWATSNADGTGLLASGRTDANGEITFYLDAGTVYIWRQKRGWNFTNPDTETVS